MVASVVCFSVMSLCVKQASNAGVAPFQIVFARVLFGFVAIVPFALIAGPRTVLATKRPFRHVLRSAVGVSAMVLLFVKNAPTTERASFLIISIPSCTMHGITCL